MNTKVWLIGGTSDSATTAKVLAGSGIPFVITVTTQTARSLYAANAAIIVGSMDAVAMRCFCQQHAIAVVIDASHPYAAQVSYQAIAVSTELNIPYLRYERNSYEPLVAKQSSNVTEFNSFEELLAGEHLTAQRVLLTVGCKALPIFQSWQNKAVLFARILPKIKSLETAIASGFTSDRLLAIRPPITLATETALWQQWNISLVVTKASGKAGGEDIKHQVSANLKIPLAIITRPKITYPQQTSDVADILAFCREFQR